MTSRAWVHQDVANLRELEAAATRALQEAGCLGGWEIREARRIADAAVAVTIAAGPAEADAAVVFEWAEHGGEDLPAFRRGARHVPHQPSSPGTPPPRQLGS